MATFAQLHGLHCRLIKERRRVVDATAVVDALPPQGLLAYLCDLDGAIIAVESELEQRGVLSPTASAMNGTQPVTII